MAAMTAIVIHATLYRDLAMKESHVALAKCVVVHQQRKQQNELSGSGDNQITDENITDGTEQQTISLFLTKITIFSHS